MKHYSGQPEHGSTQQGTEARSTRSCILVVDDDPMFRLAMSEYLGEMGFSVIEEDSGKMVVQQILAHSPVACLVDLVMDVKDGMETIMEIFALSPRPKVIAVSSNVAYLDLALGLGVDDTLAKPVSPERLKVTLDRQQVRPG